MHVNRWSGREDLNLRLRGAKKAGLQTVWVPCRHKDMPDHPSQKLQKKLASVDIFTLRRISFWTRWTLRSVLSGRPAKAEVPGGGITLSECCHSGKPR